MPKLYGQAAYQGQQDDDDPLRKSFLKNREENQWRRDWSDEQYDISADTASEEHLRRIKKRHNEIYGKYFPHLVHFSTDKNDYVPTYELTQPVSVAWSDEQDMFVATTPEYPELSFADVTAEDAIYGLHEVAERHMQALDDGVNPTLSRGWL